MGAYYFQRTWDTWSVAFAGPGGGFVSVGDFNTEHEAMARVNYLNGGTGAPPQRPEQQTQGLLKSKTS